MDDFDVDRELVLAEAVAAQVGFVTVVEGLDAEELVLRPNRDDGRWHAVVLDEES